MVSDESEWFPTFSRSCLDKMSQAVAWLCGRAFMEAVTRPPETDAPARSAASSHVVLRAIVLAGLVVCTLLLAAGLLRTIGTPTHGAGVALTSAPVAMDGCDAVRSSDKGVASIVAEADDAGGEPSCADPLRNALPRLTGTGFHPRRSAVVTARDVPPPDRPPRRA